MGSAGGTGVWGEGRAARSLLPCVEEQRQPEPVELIGDLGVEEGQQPTHLVQAVHLRASTGQSVPVGVGGTDLQVVRGTHGRHAHLLTPGAPAGPTLPGSRVLPLRGNSRA